MQPRLERRYPVSELARSWRLDRPDETTHETQIVDVSDSGLRVESTQALLPGCEIALRVNKLVIFGSVRHCREIRNGWFSAGVHIDDVIANQPQVAGHLVEVLRDAQVARAAGRQINPALASAV